MKLMVIDGNSLINRAFYGVRLLTNHEGLFTNAVYGFLSTLLKLRETYTPDRIAVCFDVKEKTFRHKEYEAYKGTRKGMPDELAQQLPLLRELLDAMGITRMEKPGFEADDLLGTLSRQANENGDTCMIVTGDKDSLQLIGEGTTVLLAVTRMGQTTTTEYTPEVFFEKYGFEPIHMIDLKALMGDTSDNIPGVPGIGEKTATGLIQKFRTIEAVYENIDDPFIKKGQRNKLLDGRESAEKSKYLVTIVRDVPLDMNASEIPEAKPDNEALYRLLTRLEFKKFIERLGLQAPEEEESAAPEKQLTIENVSDAQSLFAALEGQTEIIVTAPKSLAALCVLVQDTAYFLRADAFDTQQWRDILTRLFTEYPLTLHDAKPYLLALLQEGIKAKDAAFDTALAAYVLDPTQKGYDIERVALAYLQRGIAPETDYEAEQAFSPLGGSEQAQATLCAHAAVIAQLKQQMLPRLEEEGMHELYYDIELPLERVLANMQYDGVYTDADALRSFGETLTQRIDTLIQEIYAEAGREFKINSSDDLGAVLFEELELPIIKKPKIKYSVKKSLLEELEPEHPIVGKILQYKQLKSEKKAAAEQKKQMAELADEIYLLAGKKFNIQSSEQLGEILFKDLKLPCGEMKKVYSIDIDVLEALAGYHPIVGKIIEYRQLTKLRSTYVEGFLKLIAPDGRIHANFQQMVTATGRLSSTDPNMQNIPVRQELGSELRHMFAAKPGCVLVDADYSQIELRVLAHIANDETMIQAFLSGADIHAITASQVFGVPLEEVTPAMRRSSKAVNFGIVYGISGFSLAQDIGVSVKQAGEYIDNYLSVYHGVRDYMEHIKQQAREDGYVSSLFGRRRYLPELHSKNFKLRSMAERMALNTPIQATAADIMKIAMVRVFQRMERENMHGRLILQVHDELILEVPESEQELAMRILKEEMEAACALKAPLRADAACGHDWYAAKG